MASRRTERLLNLVICLLSTRRFLTRDEIRRAVAGYGDGQEAFERAFERDKEELRELGIPLEIGSNDPLFDDEAGYRIRRDAYALPPIELAADEMAVLGLAARFWQQASLADSSGRALLKLKAGGLEAGGSGLSAGDLRDELVGIEPRLVRDEPGFADMWHAVTARQAVEFGYRARTVLHRLDLDIPAGQTLAVVGATGAGKTTVARLAARFWDPTDGRVLLDGIDLRDLTEVDLRRAVITVTQESFLFAGSVADNIRLGRPGATRNEIEHAAEVIGAHGFISRLPDGYDTDVHQKGARLSSGQRQLVSFARAFLADPAVLILDEATSSLDVPSERLVQHALRTLLEDRTAIIIAHRLTTVEIADRVVVVDAGRVVEDGAPATLIGGDGRYAALHRLWLESLA